MAGSGERCIFLLEKAEVATAIICGNEHLEDSWNDYTELVVLAKIGPAFTSERLVDGVYGPLTRSIEVIRSADSPMGWLRELQSDEVKTCTRSSKLNLS